MTNVPDLADRRPVWIALSDLFLDTDLSPADLDALAHTLAASPFSEHQLESILYDEVLPILWPNAFAPAGVWNGFDPDWLSTRISRRLHRRIKWPSRLLPRGPVRSSWQTLRTRIHSLRT